jgi:dihydroorotase-like cyclic amidohydrolase
MPAKPIVKRPPKTIKEKKFVKKYLEIGNATEAAMQVYDASSRDSAHSIATQNLQKLSFVDILEKHGITDDKLASVLLDGLEANRTISTISGKEANGGTVDFVDVPDYAVRHKYLETGLKVKNKFPLNDGTNVDIKVLLAHANQYVD